MTSSTEDKIGTRSVMTSNSAATGAKGRRPRKELPSIQHMLIHGAPESQGKPVTFWGVAGFPLALLITFVVSLYIFQMAPHHLSTGKRHVLPPIVTENLPRSKFLNLGKPKTLNKGVDEELEL